MEPLIDQPEQQTITYPSLVTRIQSSFIDVLVIVILMFASGYVLEYFDNPPGWVRIVLFFAIWGIYEPLLTSTGCTLGQMALKVRVVRYKDPDRKIDLLSALVRYVVKLLLGWLSFLTISGNQDSRAIHDLVSGSLVISKTKT